VEEKHYKMGVDSFKGRVAAVT